MEHDSKKKFEKQKTLITKLTFLIDEITSFKKERN